MNEEIKEAINRIGGLGEWKRRSTEQWENTRKQVKKDYVEIQIPPAINLNEMSKEEIIKIVQEFLFKKDQFMEIHQVYHALESQITIREFIDQNLIDEVEDYNESYEDILLRALKNYLELKKASK